MNRVKLLQEGEMVHSGETQDGPSHGGESGKNPGERGKI